MSVMFEVMLTIYGAGALAAHAFFLALWIIGRNGDRQ